MVLHLCSRDNIFTCPTFTVINFNPVVLTYLNSIATDLRFVVTSFNSTWIYFSSIFTYVDFNTDSAVHIPLSVITKLNPVFDLNNTIVT